MPPIVFDTDSANLVAAIAACLAAFAASISVIVSVLALKRTTKQTDILVEQFKIAELERKKAARPLMRVEVSKYKPPDRGQMRGDITFTLRNAGHVGFHVVGLRTQSGNTHNQDVTRLIEVHPGYSAEIVASILPPATFNPPTLKAWFVIETDDGADPRQLEAEWELQRDQFVPLKSEMVEE